MESFPHTRMVARKTGGIMRTGKPHLEELTTALKG